jgi:hypothetical protein
MYKLLICAALGLGVVNSSAAAPQQVAELALHGLPSGAIAFADKAVLGTEQQPIIGRWEAGTSHFAIWAGHDSR